LTAEKYTLGFPSMPLIVISGGKPSESNKEYFLSKDGIKDRQIDSTESSGFQEREERTRGFRKEHR